MKVMHNPPHPGEVLKELYLEPLDLTITEAAHSLQVTRKTLSALVNGRADISPAMALRLSKAFDTTPESWLNLQQQYTLWDAQKKVDVSDVCVLFRSQNLKEDRI